MFKKIKRLIPVFLSLVFFYASTQAANYAVTGTSDSVSACTGTSCPSLRSAIRAANAAPGPDTITLPKGLFNLAIIGGNEDLAATGDLDITDELTIQGAGIGALNLASPPLPPSGSPYWYDGTSFTIINGKNIDDCDKPSGSTNPCNTNESQTNSDRDRIFHVHGTVKFTLRGLIVRAGAAENGDGGAIHNAKGNLIIDDAVFYNNKTEPLTNVSQPTKGGAIYNSGSMVISNARFERNRQSGTPDGCGFSGCGQGVPWGGGAIFNSGPSAQVTNSRLLYNVADGMGSAVYNASTELKSDSGNATNLHSGFFAILDSTIAHNFGGTKSSAGAVTNIFGTVAISKTVLSHNWGNFQSCGGAVFNISGTIRLNSSYISNNNGSTYNSSGGGLCNFDIMDVNNSTIEGNRAANGGGIYNAGNSKLTVLNSTVSGNMVSNTAGQTGQSADGGLGGGIYNSSESTITLTNVTISGNMADRLGAGIYHADVTGTGNSVSNEGYARYNNTIINSNNIVSFLTNPIDNQAWAIDTNSAQQSGNCWAPTPSKLQSRGYNIATDNSCAISLATDYISDPQIDGDLLISLNSNNGPAIGAGGETILKTHAIARSTSPAVNAITLTDSTASCPIADQRGLLRDSLCDIGAFEYGANAPAPSGVDLVISIDAASASRGSLGYVFSAENKGPQNATSVTLTAEFPSTISIQRTMVPIGGDCSFNSTTLNTRVTCTLAGLKASEKTIVRLEVLSSAAGTVTTTGTVSSLVETELYPADNSATHQIIASLGDTGSNLNTTIFTSSGGGGFGPFNILALIALVLIRVCCTSPFTKQS